MVWRKWIVRILVLLIAGACASAAVVYQRWTNPTAVRELVVGKIQQMHPQIQCAVDSARLRLLGGIAISDLRLSRRNDLDQIEILHVPSAVIFHDKEKLLEGVLALRKVELYRPRLRVIRQRDGSWNLAIFSGSQAQQQHQTWPTLVVHQGTLVFDDQLEGVQTSSVEVTDVNVTIINDPLPTVQIEGAATSELTGAVSLQGVFDRVTKDLDLNLSIRNLAIRDSLVQRVGCFCPQKSLEGLSLSAQAKVDARIRMRPHAAAEDRKLDYELRISLTKANIRHPRLPLPLDDLEASIEIKDDQIQVADLKAVSGDTRVKGRAFAMLPCPEKSFEAHLDITQAPIGPEICLKLTKKLQELQELYQATGPADVQLAVARRGDQWTTLADGSPSRVSMIPRNVKICFQKFKYPVERMTGRIDHDMLTKTNKLDLVGHAAKTQVRLKGQWKGEKEQAEGLIELTAQNGVVEEKLIGALPEKFQKLTTSFHPTGKVDVLAKFRHVVGAPRINWEYHLRVHDGTLRWDEFPYPLEKVTGLLDIYEDHWELREGVGHRNGSSVRIQGRSLPKAVRPGAVDAEGLYLEIAGADLALDDDLRNALGGLKSAPQLRGAWDAFTPRGHMNFSANIERRENRPQDMDIRVDVKGCSIAPIFFPYPLHHLSGHFRYHQNKLEIAKVRAQHRKAFVEMDYGTVELNGAHGVGGYRADFQDLEAKDLSLDDEFVAALPKILQGPCLSLKLQESVRLKTRLIVTQRPEPTSSPEVYWDGQMEFRKANVTTGVPWTDVTGVVACRGRHNGRQLMGLAGNIALEKAALFKQPLQNVVAQFHIDESTPDLFTIGVRAPFFGGDISGQARFEFNSSLRYDLNLTASQVNLQEFGRHNLGPKSQLAGTAVGRLYLTGQGGSYDTLDGNGSIDVPNGQFYNLPLLLDLLKFLGLRIPDRTAFEELHAQFGIQGMKLLLRRLELFGNAVSLTGQGEFNLDGTDLKVDLYPTPARVNQFLPPAIRPMQVAFSKNILTIEMRGKVSQNPDELKFHKRVAPGITEPWMQFRERVLENNNGAQRNEPTQGNSTQANPGRGNPTGYEAIRREESKQ